MHLGLQKLKNKIDMIKNLKLFVFASLFMGCNFIERNNLDESNKNYIEDLGLLEKAEKIIWFDSQLSLKKSGSFLSNKRLASYFLAGSEKDNFKEYAYLEEIDSIRLSDRYESISYSSFIEVFKKDGKSFKVYIDQDSSIVREYYNKTLKMLDN